MNKSKGLIIHYPPHPPYGDWLPTNVVIVYLGEHKNANPDVKKLLERIACSEIAAPAITKLANRLDFLGFGLLFDTLIDSTFLPFEEMHKALSVADRLRDSIVERANELTTLLDEYQEVCLDGKLERVDSRDHPIGPLPVMEYYYRDLLRFTAVRLPSVIHKRYGVGRAAWSSRVQSTADGLPQFVRYFDDRVKTHIESGSSTGGLTTLTPTQLARLAIPALNIKNHKDKDVLSETIERIKGIRKRG